MVLIIGARVGEGKNKSCGWLKRWSVLMLRVDWMLHSRPLVRSMVRRSSSSCCVISELVPSWMGGGQIGWTAGIGIVVVGDAAWVDVRSM